MSVTRSPFRSPVRGPAQSPFGAGRLLERTRTFRDRVKGENGSLEDDCLEGLYDPILRAYKDWGLLSDLVFFGSGSAVEINSGSIPTIFDGSGNKNDAIQTTTAKQSALDKNSVGGRWGAVLDGSDDSFELPNVPISSGYTFLYVADVNTAGGPYHIIEADDGSDHTAESLLETDGSFSNGNKHFEFVRNGGGGSENRTEAPRGSYPLLRSVRYDGQNPHEIYENKSDLSETVNEDSTSSDLSSTEVVGLGARTIKNTNHTDGNLPLVVIMNTIIAESKLKTLEDICSEYYDNIY
jgi:hypothetical protein